MAGAPFWFAGFLSLAFGLFYGGRGIHEALMRRQLRQEGVTTEAVVIDHQVTGGPRSPTTYYVKYRYHSQGQSYEREEKVSCSSYNAWPRGKMLPVSYLPQHPHVVRITNEKNRFPFAGVILIILGIFLMVLALLVS